MIKPKVLVFSGYGLNCEEETKYAFEAAGAKANIIHINDLIDKPNEIKKYQIITFPGGFSYGDDTGSGNGYANKLRNHIWENIKDFVERDTLTIGICNGFQILVNLGLLPAINKKYGKREVALINNDSARYTVRWVDLKAKSKSPWLVGLEKISLPIAHGEGKFYAEKNILKTLHSKNLIALTYIKDDMCEYQNLDANPNGSIDDVAGITDETGRIFGLMPHPERAISFTHLPNWTYLKENYLREGKEIPENGPGIKIFQNAVAYFK